MQLTFHCLIKKTYNPTHIVTIEIITTYEEFTGYPAKLIFTYFPNNLSIFKRLMILIYLNGDNKLLSGIYLCIINSAAPKIPIKVTIFAPLSMR